MEKGTKTGIVMVIIFIIGLGVGYYFGSSSTPTVLAPSTTNEKTAPTETGTAATMNDEQSVASGAVSETVPEEGIKIDSSRMSSGQKTLLNTLGIDADNITLTPEMVACAEAKVGAARLQEIQNGATPSFMEGASLATCYR